MEKVNFRNLKSPYIIAEIGGNHSANIDLAKKGIINAKKAGANCVKFQMYRHSEIVHPRLKILPHVKNIAKEKTQSERFKKLELSELDIIRLYKQAKKTKIDFATTPFSVELVKFLQKYVSFFKVASGDLDFFPMIEEIAKYKKNIVISTGMSDLKKIKETLKILKKNNVVILHCISSYPTISSDLNLNSIDYLQKAFNIQIGLSDHTKNNIGSIVAVGKGVKIFEKHFLPDAEVKKVGDYELSLNPYEMKKYCSEINEAFSSLGKKEKRVFNCEKKFYANLCRSIYFSNEIKKGSKITFKDLSFIRPFNLKGLKIKNYKKLIGKKAKKNFKKLELVKKNFIF